MLHDLRAMLNNVSLFDLVQEANATRVIICRAQNGARRIMCCRWFLDHLELMKAEISVATVAAAAAAAA
jgi:hypothetical protein